MDPVNGLTLKPASEGGFQGPVRRQGSNVLSKLLVPLGHSKIYSRTFFQVKLPRFREVNQLAKAHAADLGFETRSPASQGSAHNSPPSCPSPPGNVHLHRQLPTSLASTISSPGCLHACHESQKRVHAAPVSSAVKRTPPYLRLSLVQMGDLGLALRAV